MSVSRHTPGPWRVVIADDYEIHSSATPEESPHRFKDDDLGRFVALVGNRAPDFGLADARLIAAAPEMLTALRRIAEGNLGDDPWQANYDKIRAVATAAMALTQS